MEWSDVLASEKEKPYFKHIMAHLKAERAQGKAIYPAQSLLFNALKLTPYNDVKVVILGQDPYHGPGQAHGLCFSVQPGVPAPPSLQNIFKELESDLGLKRPKDGCLEKWAKQGVLLLNASLSVEQSKPQSHAKLGWETFTDAVIKSLNQHQAGIIYLLWGSSAKKKRDLIDESKHIALTAPHPSPLSAHRGFLGCHHFSKANALLESLGREPVNWQL